jgi:hypothetical protein
MLLDIAIGASGSEKIILSNYSWIWTGVEAAGTAPSPFFAIPIPAGTRISARIAVSSGAANFGITAYGVYR